MPATLTLRLLGTPLIEVDNQPLTNLPSRAAEALLIYLACSGRTHARDVVAEMLWIDRDQPQTLANLRSSLSSLRRKLKPFLNITRQTVAMNEASDYWVDVIAFEEQLRDIARQQPDGDRLPPDVVEQLEETLALYRGDFLEGFHLRSGRGFEEWAVLQRERLRRLAHRELFRLVRHYLSAGDYALGLSHAGRLLAIDPLDERAQRATLLLLARNGQRNAALQQYEKLRTLLERELNVAPASETIRLYERIRTARGQALHNLPPQSTPFVGRTRTLHRLLDDLAAPDGRLLTILGPGGIGKTRLLLELGRRLVAEQQGRFLHGVRFVPLAHLESAEFLAAALAEALGVTLGGSTEPAEEVLDYLREKEVLLLLDNFEHLLEEGTAGSAFGLLEAVLREAPFVKMVVTSRERLLLQEEWVHDLSGLRTPPREWEAASDAVLVETAESFSALALFLQSARRAVRQFRPTPSDLRAVAAVCRRLDGLPLGIELAASWVRQFSCETIWEQIDQDLDFLVAPARNVPERHRSLRAVFDHSWQLLEEGERATVAALAVFQDAFPVAAAQQVANASPALLAALVDKSFLQRSRPGGQFEMHPLLRQYAAEHLAQESMPQPEALRDAHARYFATLVESRERLLEGEGQNQAYRDIGEVIDDIRAAWSWSLNNGRYDITGRFLEGLFSFYWARGWLQEGAQRAQHVVETVLAQTRDERLVLARAQMWLGEFYGWLGQYEEAVAHLQEAIATFEALDGEQARRGLTFSFSSLGRAYHNWGAHEKGKEAVETCLALARQADDTYWVALALNSLAISVTEVDADYELGWAYFKESLEAARSIGDRFGTARALVNMGTIAQGWERMGEAQCLYEESLAIYREVEYEHGIAAALNYLGELAYLTGDYERAQALIQEGHDRDRESGNRRAMAESLRRLGNVAREAGDEREARRRYEEALRLTQEIGAEQVALAILVDAAALLARHGDDAVAQTLLIFILEESEAGKELCEAAQQIFDEIAPEQDPGCIDHYRQHAQSLTLSTAGTLFLHHH
jgi:predicted ATPase/DNA-binding SARP family transcriptional activator